MDYNRLLEISGLENCCNLKRLFLNRNCINKINGLHYCSSLQELYLNDQNISNGLGMNFDKDSMIGISDSLRQLEIEGNEIWNIENLEFLCNLFSI